MTDVVAAWIASHRVVDVALQIALVGIASIVTLGSLCASVYLVLFLRRLTRIKNWRRFTSQPIPAVIGGKLFGAEVTLGSIEEAEMEAVAILRATDMRLGTLEVAMRRVEMQVASMETVSGLLRPRLTTSGGSNG